jgi:hypothetical protein
MKLFNKTTFSPLSERNLRYVIVALISLVIIVFAAGMILFTAAAENLCNNRIAQELYSPDHKFKAVVYERDCGATTNFSTQISILRSSQALPRGNGNVLGMDGMPEDSISDIAWSGDRSLSINTAEGYAIFFQAKSFRWFLTGIDIDIQ